MTDILTSARKILSPIHPDGWKFIGVFALTTFVLAFFADILGAIGAGLTGWCAYFFRDPERMTPTRPGLVISPADGLILSTDPSVPPEELGLGSVSLPRISIFMNVFDVHVNRIPIDGKIEEIAYRPGSFVNASLDKASEQNERQSVRVAGEQGAVGVVQIAGLIARRIRSDINVGQQVLAGERYGLIRFGSRVDLYLPQGVAPQVIAGQRAIAGETVCADLAGHEPARKGKVR
jgi:phosphatidylserine decarboxylase